MIQTHRINEFLSLADPIYWTPNPHSDNYRPATVNGITLDGAKILVVKWSNISECQILLDNGKTIDGNNTMPAEGTKPAYQYPETIRLN